VEGGGGGSYSVPSLSVSPFCVSETGPEEHRSAKHVSTMNWVGVGGADSTASLEYLPNTLQKICETLKSVWAFFYVFSRYQSILGNTCKSSK
jgi:hypothetical protein